MYKKCCEQCYPERVKRSLWMRLVLGRRAYRCAYCQASLLLLPQQATALRMGSSPPLIDGFLARRSPQPEV